MAEPLPKHRAREYETIFIINPDASAETIEQIATRVTDVISKREGKLLRAENWGKRRLAYSVQKKRQGYYLYLRYLGYSDLVHEIERNFRMLEPVIKYLTVKIDEDVNPDARPVSEEDISFAPQVEEVPDDVVDELPVHEIEDDVIEEDVDAPDDMDDEDDDMEGEDDDESDNDDDDDASVKKAAPTRKARIKPARESVPDVDAESHASSNREDEDTDSPEKDDQEEV